MTDNKRLESIGVNNPKRYAPAQPAEVALVLELTAGMERGD